MRELIKGQTIRFDAHDSGSGRPVAWGNGLHLHKIMNEHKYRGVEILIPLDSAKEIEFRKSYDGDVERRILDEISEALNKNTHKRRELIRVLLKQIDRFSKSMTTKERIANLKYGANKIAEIFGLKDSFDTEIDQNLDFCLSKHFDEKNKICLVLQDLREETIKLGENQDILMDEDAFPPIN